MIDIQSEDLVPLADAAQHVPGRPHISTLHRWRLKGIRGVQLETVRVGGRRYTSREALERFFAATTAASSGDSPSRRTPRQRRQQIAAADRLLDEEGI